MKKLLTAIAIATALFCGCSGVAHSAASAPPVPAPDYQVAAARDAAAGNAAPAAPSVAEAPVLTSGVITGDQAANGLPLPGTNLKIIYTGILNIQTRDLQTAIQGVNRQVQKYNAFISSSNINNGNGDGSGGSSASFEIRVPKDSFSGFMNESGQIGTVVSQSISSQDVTNQYYDTDTRLKALKIKHDRLLDMLSKATDTKTLLDIENALSDTEINIDQLTGQLNQMSSLVDYSTVDINIQVVKIIAPVTGAQTSYFGGVAARFGKSLASVALFLMDAAAFILGNLPVIIFLALIALVIWLIVRAAVRGKNAAGAKKWDSGAPEHIKSAENPAIKSQEEKPDERGT